MISLIAKNLNKKFGIKYPELKAKVTYNDKYLIVNFYNPAKLSIRYECEYINNNCLSPQEIMSAAIDSYRYFILKKYFN